jgi:hypothetical protein
MRSPGLIVADDACAAGESASRDMLAVSVAARRVCVFILDALSSRP